MLPSHFPGCSSAVRHPPRNRHLVGNDISARCKGADDLRRDLRLALAHMVLAEEELAVQVACLDCVEVNLWGASWQGCMGRQACGPAAAARLLACARAAGLCCGPLARAGAHCHALHARTVDFAWCSGKVCARAAHAARFALPRRPRSSDAAAAEAHHLDVLKPRQNQGFQQLAADAASAHTQHFCALDLGGRDRGADDVSAGLHAMEGP
jgi:hypothetical protein